MLASVCVVSHKELCPCTYLFRLGGNIQYRWKLLFHCEFLHLFSIFALFACSTVWALVRRRVFQSCCAAFLGKHDLIVTSSGAFAAILTFYSFMLCQSSQVLLLLFVPLLFQSNPAPYMNAQKSIFSNLKQSNFYL